MFTFLPFLTLILKNAIHYTKNSNKIQMRITTNSSKIKDEKVHFINDIITSQYVMTRSCVQSYSCTKIKVEKTSGDFDHSIAIVTAENSP